MMGNKNSLGFKFSEVSKMKMSIAKIGKTSPVKGMHWKLSIEARKNISEGHKGEKSHLWRGGKSKYNQRNTFEYKLWRESVFKRDNYTCLSCGVRGGELHAHHIKPFSLFPELCLAIDNGSTLCKECHKKTDTYLYKMNKYKNT